jgi:excisionase family DNA binding protein
MTEEGDDLITAPEMAERLGVNERTVYRYIAQQYITSTRRRYGLRHRYEVRRADFEAALPRLLGAESGVTSESSMLPKKGAWLATVYTVYSVDKFTRKREAMSDTEYLKPRDIAKKLGVTRGAVYKWIREGKLKSVRFGPNAVRIRREDLEEFERRAALDRGGTIEESSKKLTPAASLY